MSACSLCSYMKKQTNLSQYSFILITSMQTVKHQKQLFINTKQINN